MERKKFCDTSCHLDRNKKSLVKIQGFLFIGSPGRIRTADPMINSHLLYRLSYRGINFLCLVRLERFELPTDRFVADYSIQLSYKRVVKLLLLFLIEFLSNVNFKFSTCYDAYRTQIKIKSNNYELITQSLWVLNTSHLRFAVR